MTESLDRSRGSFTPFENPLEPCVFPMNANLTFNAVKGTGLRKKALNLR